MKRAVVLGFFQILVRVRICQSGRPSQLPYASPAVSALPLRHQLQDLIDGVVLLVGPEFDAGDQKLINSWQQARVEWWLASDVFDNARHTQKRAASQSGLHDTYKKRGRNADYPRAPRSA